jgi:hypothetical protein
VEVLVCTLIAAVQETFVCAGFERHLDLKANRIVFIVSYIESRVDLVVMIPLPWNVLLCSA